MTTTTEAPKTLEPVRFTCRRYVTTHTIAAYMTPPLVTNGNTNLESLIEHASAFRAFIKRCLDRHHQMDCGDMDAEDKATNDDALLSGARLFSSYNIPDELKRQSSEPGFNDDAFPNDNIWIITEAVDGLPNTRDLTTVLSPPNTDHDHRSNHHRPDPGGNPAADRIRRLELPPSHAPTQKGQRPMNVTLTLTTEQLAYLMVAAFEGGSGYWCTRARPEPEDVSAFDAPWYSDKRFYEQDSWRVICTDTDDDGNDVEHPLTAETIAKGLAVIAEKYPFRLPAIFGDHDAEDADVFLQCCALGDIVYG